MDTYHDESISPEFYKDQIFSGNSATTVTFHLLSDIATGDSFDNRNGRQAYISSLESRNVVIQPKLAAAAGDGDADSVRVIVFTDHQANGATPAGTDLLATENYLSPFNGSERDRFEIHYDETFDIAHTAADAHDWNEVRESEALHVPIQNMIWYSGSSGVIAEQTTSAVYICHIATSTRPEYEFYTRIHFLP